MHTHTRILFLSKKKKKEKKDFKIAVIALQFAFFPPLNNITMDSFPDQYILVANTS